MKTPTRRPWLLALALAPLAFADVVPAQRRYAGLNEVCRVGTRPDRSRRGVVARPCAPGLRCCYPCGIPGCDSVCMRDCGPPRP